MTNVGTITVLSTNRQSSENASSLPSIFDYLAQDSLRAQLKPGILAGIKGLFSSKFPTAAIFRFLEKHFDLIFLLFQSTIEFHYLQRFSGSFSENFYGMKRVPINNSNPLLSFSQKIRSLITLVILPFIGERLTKIYEHLKINFSGSKNIFGWRFLLLRLFPFLRTFNYFAIILFQIGYTFSFIKFPSWLLLISGTRLEIFLSRCLQLLFWLPSTIGRILSLSLFLIQFLEICYKDEFGILLNKIINGNNKLINFEEFPLNKLPVNQQSLCRAGKCPICGQIRNEEAVLSISGYIFCYSCIYKFITLNGRCPVTSLPASINEIIKIYR
ncbi:unnamed protein product [Meloidogyne enterolobii]|uniref:Uncharacterized protein n=1 Tax=Meloidogyne enterolobii TaxID=390850 RepID=A0ACB0YP02_MELEN